MLVRRYTFKAKVWRHSSAGWYFVTLPQSLSKKIRSNHLIDEEGWGRLKVTAQVDTQLWESSIWYDTKADAYLLPLKAAVRKSLSIEIGKQILVDLKVKTMKTSIRRLFG